MMGSHILNRNQNTQGTTNLQELQNHKKGIKSGMSFNTNTLIESNVPAPPGTTGSVQTTRKRRAIMHDNLTNSRGTNRIQQNMEGDLNMNPMDARNNSSGQAMGIGMISPPTLPGSRQQNLNRHLNDNSKLIS